MKKELTEILRINRAPLCAKIDGLTVLNNLGNNPEEVITKKEVEDIKLLGTNSEKVGRLLDRLPGRPDGDYVHFCNAIIDANQIHIVRDCLQNGLQYLPRTSVEALLAKLAVTDIPSSVSPAVPLPVPVSIGSNQGTTVFFQNTGNVSLPHAFSADTGVIRGDATNVNLAVASQSGSARAGDVLDGGSREGSLATSAQDKDITEDIKFDNGPGIVTVTHTTKESYSHLCQVTSDMYRMDKQPRGKALIINIQAMKAKQRRGTDIDRTKLKDLWEQLYFTVKVEDKSTGFTCTMLLECVKDFVDGLRDSDQACIICVLSHGGNGYVCGTDGTTVTVDSLKGCLRGKFLGKPKMLVFQACRGSCKDPGVEFSGDDDDVDDESEEEEEDEFHGQLADILECYPTVEGFTAGRNRETGGWFIEALVKIFAKCAHNTPVVELMRLVGNVVDRRLMKKITEQYRMQTAQTVSTLKKVWYFNPGIKQ